MIYKLNHRSIKIDAPLDPVTSTDRDHQRWSVSPDERRGQRNRDGIKYDDEYDQIRFEIGRLITRFADNSLPVLTATSVESPGVQIRLADTSAGSN